MVVTLRAQSGAKLFLARLADSDLGSNSRGAAGEQVEARKWANKSFAALGGCLKAVSDKAKVLGQPRTPGFEWGQG